MSCWRNINTVDTAGGDMSYKRRLSREEAEKVLAERVLKQEEEKKSDKKKGKNKKETEEE